MNKRILIGVILGVLVNMGLTSWGTGSETSVDGDICKVEVYNGMLAHIKKFQESHLEKVDSLAREVDILNVANVLRVVELYRVLRQQELGFRLLQRCYEVVVEPVLKHKVLILMSDIYFLGTLDGERRGYIAERACDMLASADVDIGFKTLVMELYSEHVKRAPELSEAELKCVEFICNTNLEEAFRRSMVAALIGYDGRTKLSRMKHMHAVVESKLSHSDPVVVSLRNNMRALYSQAKTLAEEGEAFLEAARIRVDHE